MPLLFSNTSLHQSCMLCVGPSYQGRINLRHLALKRCKWLEWWFLVEINGLDFQYESNFHLLINRSKLYSYYHKNFFNQYSNGLLYLKYSIPKVKWDNRPKCQFVVQIAVFGMDCIMALWKIQKPIIWSWKCRY